MLLGHDNWDNQISLEVGCEGVSRMVVRAHQILKDGCMPFYHPTGSGNRVVHATSLLMSAGGLCEQSKDRSGGDGRRLFMLRLYTKGVRALVGAIELLLLAVINGKVPLDCVAGALAPACMSLAGGDAAAMVALQASATVAAGVKHIRFKHNLQAKQLHMLCSIKYAEPLVVLDPVGKRGWAFEVNGVADNFQLMGLLNPTLGPAGLMEQTYSAAAMRSWQGVSDEGAGSLVCVDATLMQFTAVRPDGTVDWAREHFVWGEGVPIDILRLHGERVCLVAAGCGEKAPFRIKRLVPVGRIFSPVKARVQLVATFSTAEVEGKLKKMSAVGPEMRARAQALIAERNGLG